MPSPVIYVLAGVNGSGKSSLLGSLLESRGLSYYNPDEAARKLRELHPAMTPFLANSHAWSLGKEMLEDAIARRRTFAFETTLGGNTITALLLRAAGEGLAVRIGYVGLDSVERNLARVRQRVARGGHDIPEADIRRRWDGSRRNLIGLLPSVERLRLLDNAREADPMAGQRPEPELLLDWADGRILGPRDLAGAPDWAKPIIEAALQLQARA